MRVYCIDPGLHIGWAYWTDAVSLERREDPTIPSEKFYSGEWTPAELFDGVEDLVQISDVLVCEAFIIGGSRTKSSNETIEQIGVMRFLAKRHDTPFFEQQPGAGKRFAGKGWSTLKHMGWYRPGPDHANSAAGHLLIYLCENHLIDRRRLLTPAPISS